MGLSMWFRVLFDSGAVKRGFASMRHEAKATMASVNKDVSKDLGRSIKRTIGPLALGGLSIGGIMQSTEAAKDIENLANKLGITAEQAQKLELATKLYGDQALKTAESVTESMKLLEGVSVTDNRTNAELAAASRDLASAMSTFKANVAPGVALAAKGASGFAKGWTATTDWVSGLFSKVFASALAPGSVTEMRKLLASEKEDRVTPALTPDQVAKVVQQYGTKTDAVTKTKADADKARNPPVSKVDADALQRIGLFVGGAPVGLLGLQKQQLAELRKHTDAFRRLESAVNEI